MKRAMFGAVAGVLVVGLAGCNAGQVPTGIEAPAQAMRTQQFLGAGCGPCGPVGPPIAQSVVVPETCAVPALVPTPVPVSTPVLTATAVPTAVPITRLVPVTSLAPAAALIPTVANVPGVLNLPTLGAVPVTQPVVYSQFCSPWVPTGAGPALPAAPIAPPPACAPLGVGI